MLNTSCYAVWPLVKLKFVVVKYLNICFARNLLPVCSGICIQMNNRQRMIFYAHALKLKK